MDRRAFLGAGTGLMVTYRSMVDGKASAAPGALLSFDQLLAESINSGLVSEGRNLRDRQIGEYLELAERGLRDRRPLSNVAISDRATKMIWAFEITSPQKYMKSYTGATWPKGQSGVTIGVGYDVGYVTVDWLHEDWDDAITPSKVKPLEVACGKTGQAAKLLVPELSAVNIDWPTAQAQFQKKVLPRYVSDTLAALPKAAGLGPDCIGSLVSLTYNRGDAYALLTDRYREMRAIKQHIADEQYQLVPDEMRKMERLWRGQPDMAGLIVRRELEAKLFDEGLHSRRA